MLLPEISLGVCREEAEVAIVDDELCGVCLQRLRVARDHGQSS